MLISSSSTWVFEKFWIFFAKNNYKLNKCNYFLCINGLHTPLSRLLWATSRKSTINPVDMLHYSTFACKEWKSFHRNISNKEIRKKKLWVHKLHRFCFFLPKHAIGPYLNFGSFLSLTFHVLFWTTEIVINWPCHILMPMRHPRD